MSKRLGLSLLLLMIVTVSACRPQAAIPTLVSTIDASTPEIEDTIADRQVGDLSGPDEQKSVAAAAEEPDIDPTAFEGSSDEQAGSQNEEPVEIQQNPAAEDPGNATELTGVELLWLAISDSSGQDPLVVAEPSLYTIEFSKDGAFIYQADCNKGGGAYVQEGNQLSLDLGVVTLAVCSDDSIADQYIQYLRDVVSYDSSSGQLLLGLANVANQMKFGQVPAVEPEAAEVTITGIEWLWSNFADPSDGPFSISKPQDYSFVLLPDGIVQINADCNVAEGTYSLEGSALSISTDVTTSADCGPDSMWDSFVQYLNGAALQFIQDNGLFIDLIYDSGTMRFEHGGSIGG